MTAPAPPPGTAPDIVLGVVSLKKNFMSQLETASSDYAIYMLD
jgi:hypothetical protein